MSDDHRQLGMRVVEHPEAPKAAIPMCFTREALEALRNSVGVWLPETGAKGFGPPDRIGVDVIEFDHRGSSRGRSAVYAPDAAWGNQRMAYWLRRPENALRLWTMDCHSHPGRTGYPSSKAGSALGDLGYAEAVFEQNEIMQFFFIPILTGTGPDAAYVELHPWMVCRDDPHTPLWAEVRITEEQQFPERIFNPEWERSIAMTVSEPRPARAVVGQEDAAADTDHGRTGNPHVAPDDETRGHE
jgi:hypothetical protein